MLEVHGMRVAKLSAAGAADSQTITVEDGPGYSIVSLGSTAFPAALSPAEAREFAARLLASAVRVEQMPTRT